MPTYEYECQSCGTHIEVRQKVTDEPIKVCAECGGAMRKVLFPVGVIFKGSGWYITDSRKSDSATTSTEKKSGETSTKTESSTADSGAKSAASAAGESTSGTSSSTSESTSTTSSSTKSSSVS